MPIAFPRGHVAPKPRRMGPRAAGMARLQRSFGRLRRRVREPELRPGTDLLYRLRWSRQLPIARFDLLGRRLPERRRSTRWRPGAELRNDEMFGRPDLLHRLRWPRDLRASRVGVPGRGLHAGLWFLQQ